ncbi:MAG: 50S ribosomal protein L10 [Candidatus Dojkabacteria bacterium]|nr:50S ribosomal protein L10 [Candidatus Dojkabacteria bacterium]
MKRSKKDLLETYKKTITDSKSLVIIRAKGLTPGESTNLRKKLYDFDSSFRVVKNTLFKLALKESEFEEEDSLNNYEHAVVFMGEDIVGPSKILNAFLKETKNKEGKPKAEVVSGYLDASKLSKDQVIELAEMPDKEGSISMIPGVLDQAIAGVANVLQNPVQSYASILDQAFKE